MFSATFCLVLAMLSADPVQEQPSVEANAEKRLTGLPGQSAFLFSEITDLGIQPLYGVRADERLAVGSSFKLYILGTLVADVNAGRRKLTDTMQLQSRLEGPPHSEMAAWPVGLPVTVSTLALKMIWQSDNTATDHLHFLLGREAIERQMRIMGHSQPSVNTPLLSTREMTILRDKKKGLPGRDYRKLDDAARRAFLAKATTENPDYKSLDFDTAAFDVAEWYASAEDMARSLAWIAHQTAENFPAQALRQVLTVDPKLNFNRETWTYVGFKGGSEEQILAGNWLLRHKNGKWYTLHLVANNPSGPVDPKQFLSVLEPLLSQIESELATEAGKPSR